MMVGGQWRGMVVMVMVVVMVMMMGVWVKRCRRFHMTTHAHSGRQGAWHQRWVWVTHPRI